MIMVMVLDLLNGFVFLLLGFELLARGDYGLEVCGGVSSGGG